MRTEDGIYSPEVGRMDSLRGGSGEGVQEGSVVGCRGSQAGCRGSEEADQEERVLLGEGTAQTKARSGNEKSQPEGDEKPPD